MAGSLRRSRQWRSGSLSRSHGYHWQCRAAGSGRVVVARGAHPGKSSGLVASVCVRGGCSAGASCRCVADAAAVAACSRARGAAIDRAIRVRLLPRSG
eukprot:2204338-Prymnesium_polylepis.1